MLTDAQVEQLCDAIRDSVHEAELKVSLDHGDGDLGDVAKALQRIAGALFCAVEESQKWRALAERLAKDARNT